MNRALGESLETFLARLLRLATTFAWPTLYALSAAFSAWCLRHRAELPQLAKNKLAEPVRLQMGRWALVAAACVAFVYLVAAAAQSLAARRWSGLRACGELNRRFAFVLGLPFAAALLSAGIEGTDPIWTCVMAGCAAVPFGVSAYHLRGRPALDDAHEPTCPSLAARALYRLAPIGAFAAVLALWGGYGLLLSRLSIANHHALNTRTIDLGYYDNVFYNSIHGRPLACSFLKGGTHSSAHFDPILVLLSPLYLLYPRAELLLVLQSVWVGMGVIPAYLLGARTLSRPAGLVLALAYVLYPGLHGANLYEFHSLTLVAPLVLWLFYFLERRAWLGYGATLVLLCLCREDVPLMLCFVGLYCLVSHRQGLGRAGALTIAFCVAYYLVARRFFMPSKDLLNSASDGSYSYAYYFDELIPGRRGLPELLLSLVTNPMFVVRMMFDDPQKILYLLVLFVPLGLLPLFARHARLSLLYGLAVTMLASRKPVFQIGFQYAALIFPLAFAIAPQAIARAMDRGAWRGLDPAGIRRAALALVTVASLIVSWKFGALVENQAFRGGFGRIARYSLTAEQKKEYADLRKLADLIEPGASVLVTNRVGAHVSNRKDVYLMHQRRPTYYVLADETELTRERWHDERVKKGELTLVERAGRFALWRATTPASK